MELIAQSLVFLVVFYLLHKKNDKDEDRIEKVVSSYSSMTELIAEEFITEISKIEQTHFEQITKLVEAMQPKPTPIIGSDLLDKNEKIENSIEKEEMPEPNLADMPRIPIVDGVNIQFEGEEEIYPFTPE